MYLSELLLYTTRERANAPRCRGTVPSLHSMLMRVLDAGEAERAATPTPVLNSPLVMRKIGRE